MRTAVRWIIVVAAVLVVIGLVAFARGPEHHRGDEVGALLLGASTSVTG